ncbi:sigma 54-interacting transcriptional regulator, partial [bacterium]|nr:sigma 54-interacting transcriptional regulator [bacterium]
KEQGQREPLTEAILEEVAKLNSIISRFLDRTRPAIGYPEDRKLDYQDIVGESKRMKEVYERIDKIAKTNSTVLICGESGTGKELVARAIHHRGLRRDNPFVAIDCGALPESLLESELFGHVKGAFTGAFKAKEGLFKIAQGGTIFLDEVGMTSSAIQMKLLRVLQERELRPVGGTEGIKVDVRVIAATNTDLEGAVRRGGFRKDLFYRLSVIPLHLPPLRERREDIPLLVEHFLRKYQSSNLHEGVLPFRGASVDHPTKTASPEAIKILCRYHWPGNVRELENVVERAVALSDNTSISPSDLPEEIQKGSKKKAEGGSLRDLVEEFECSLINETLREVDGNKYQTAKRLGLSRQDLQYKVKKHGL